MESRKGDLSFDDIIEKYAEFLTESDNKDALLEIGRNMFTAKSTPFDFNESFKLLDGKEKELSKTTHRINSISSRYYIRSKFPAIDTQSNLSPEQINEEIGSLLSNIQGLKEEKHRLLNHKSRHEAEYKEVIYSGHNLKKKLKKEKLDLMKELDELMDIDNKRKKHTDVFHSAMVDQVMKELQEANNEIISRIRDFRLTVKEALNHCERSFMDRYQSMMSHHLDIIFKDSYKLPCEEIEERIYSSVRQLQQEIATLAVDYKFESERNEQAVDAVKTANQQLDLRQADVNKYRISYAEILKEIANLNEVSRLASVRMNNEYLRLLSEEDQGSPIESARAIVVSKKPTIIKPNTNQRKYQKEIIIPTKRNIPSEYRKSFSH